MGRQGPRALLLLVLLVLTACGRPGPPVAPERVSPQPAIDLIAVVVDGGVELAFTLPTRRADNARLRDLVRVHLFRTEDDGAGDPKPALVDGGRIAGYAEIAAIRVAEPAPAVLARGRMTFVDRATPTPGRHYTYVVLAEDARGHVSPPSSRLSVTLIPVPLAPAAVRATPGDREVRVEWRPPARLADGTPVAENFVYQVLRGTGDEPLDVVTNTAAGATSFVDRSVENERPYAYAVRASRTARGTTARSAASERVTATPVDTTPPGPPTELVAIPSEGAVRLAWVAGPDPDVARYIVYRGREGAALERVGSTTAPATTFTDRNVPSGRWRYAVSAQDTSSRANESRPSPEVTVTVP